MPEITNTAETSHRYQFGRRSPLVWAPGQTRNVSDKVARHVMRAPHMVLTSSLMPAVEIPDSEPTDVIDEPTNVEDVEEVTFQEVDTPDTEPAIDEEDKAAEADPEPRPPSPGRNRRRPPSQ